MRVAILIQLCFLLSKNLWADTVVVDTDFKSVEFNERFYVFIDNNNIWKEKGIENIKHEDAFSVYNKKYLKLRSNHPVVLKFVIKTSDITQEDFILDFQHADIDRLQLYIEDNEGNFFVSNILGDKQPFNNRYIKYRFFAIPLKLLPQKEYKVFLSLEKPKKVITAKISLSTLHEWQNTAINSNIKNGLLLGLFFSFIIIGIILFIILYDRIYLYYSAYAFMIFMLLFSINGYSYQFLFPCSSNLQQYFIVFVQLMGLIFLNLYAFNFTGLSKHSIVFSFIKSGFISIYLVYIVITCFLLGHNYSIEYFLGNMLMVIELINFLFLLTAPLWLYYKTRKQAALAFFVSYLTVGISLCYSTVSFIIPQLRYYLLIDFLTIGLFTEMLILSTYMIFRYKSVLKHKQQTETALQIERTKNQLAFIEGQEQEKKNMALYLHDHISSQLFIALSKIKSIINDISLNEENKKNIHEAEKNIYTVNSELRSISHQLLPVALESVGLVASLNQFVNEHSNYFKTHFHAQDMPDKLNHNTVLNIYRIIQELLKNALQHSNASNVYIQLMGYENYCELHYEDDGKGFDINNFTKGIGFRSIDFRVQLLNADIQLQSNINKGLFIYIKIPLNK